MQPQDMRVLRRENGAFVSLNILQRNRIITSTTDIEKILYAESPS
jgi:hypothetical protein